MKFSVLVPAYNEADRIADTLKAIKTIQGIDEIICIDDGSTDETAIIAASIEGVKTICLECNQGKGAALNRGLNEAKGDVILMLDGDLGDTAREARPLLEPVLNGEADMSIAVLPRAKRGGSGIVVRTARFAVFRATGRWFPAPLSGQRAVKRWVLDRIIGLRGKAFEDRYGVETALNIDACLVGAGIVEVALPMEHRELGKTAMGWKHRAKQMLDIYHAVYTRQ